MTSTIEYFDEPDLFAEDFQSEGDPTTPSLLAARARELAHRQGNVSSRGSGNSRGSSSASALCDLKTPELSFEVSNPEEKRQQLRKLKSELALQLVNESEVAPPEGIPTGFRALDEALLWKGLPKGELSVFSGLEGQGASSLCLGAIASLHRQGKWAAWINSEWSLFPIEGMDLRWDRLIVAEAPADDEKFFWILQEMISSALFDLIACHLPRLAFKNHQLAKLKSLARTYHVALVFLTIQAKIHPLYALVVDCLREGLCIRRALHRPCPSLIEGVSPHARSLSAIFQRSRFLLG